MMEEVQQQWAPSATSADANEGTSEVSTALGRVKVRIFKFTKYRVCIEPTNAEAQEIIAERLSGSGGWHRPDSQIPYFTKIFSIDSSDEAREAVRP
jgi:hypothetical protein